jgi:hypothetical protein
MSLPTSWTVKDECEVAIGVSLLAPPASRAREKPVARVDERHPRFTVDRAEREYRRLTNEAPPQGP